jgi:hypothetical protein
MLRELKEFKNLLQKTKDTESPLQEIKDAEEEKKQFLDRTVLKHRIDVTKISKDEKIIVKRIKEVLILNNHKYSWLSLRIYDSSFDDAYVFGREKDISNNVERISKIVSSRQEAEIGNVIISLIHGEVDLEHFI